MELNIVAASSSALSHMHSYISTNNYIHKMVVEAAVSFLS